MFHQVLQAKTKCLFNKKDISKPVNPDNRCRICLYIEEVRDMGKITVVTSDGKVHTDPSEIFIPRNEKYAMFYRIVDQHVMPEEVTASGGSPSAEEAK